MLSLILGNKNYSSWSLRAWLAVAATGEPFEETVIPLYQDNWGEKIRSHSPSGLVPVLHDGGVTVWESLAICEYMAERHLGLWPSDVGARAHARTISAEMHGGFGALRQAMTMNIRKVGQRLAASLDLDRDIQRIIGLWTGCLNRFGGKSGGGGEFLFGGFTIADAMFAPVVSRFRTYGVELDGEARAYSDAVWESPMMRKWRAAAEAEPWVIEKYEL